MEKETVETKNTTPYRNSLLSCSTLTGSMQVRALPVPTIVCEICGETFNKKAVKANHIRWKHIEPFKPVDRKQKSQKWLDAMHRRKGKKQSKADYSCPFCKKNWSTTASGFAKHKKYCKLNPERSNGPWKGKHRSEETKRKLSEAGLKNPYRRLMRKTQLYKGILYDSSWEVEFAKRLESLNETFERPEKPLKYTGTDGKEHNYFPDFYLKNRKVYVEVKNPYLFKNDSKVKILRALRDDIIWLTSLEQIRSFV